ncbi:MAG: heavy metal transporter [Deltaproteobacteria bacterium RIFCSPLOWO2_02_FULL_53_8]|nr:MAG: heavy metal transporter [Deltaproteobacteria bacterium RIFCSPLOWO2_02_FULL_53_8]
MFAFKVTDMTCGHCVSSITMAVKDVDPNASVETDLSEHLVRVESVSSVSDIEDAIREAGYSPVFLR